MAIITFSTRKAISVPINAALNILTNHGLLKGDRFFFSLGHVGRAEADIKDGFRNSVVVMEYKSLARQGARSKRYSYYGPLMLSPSATGPASAIWRLQQMLT